MVVAGLLVVSGVWSIGDAVCKMLVFVVSGYLVLCVAVCAGRLGTPPSSISSSGRGAKYPSAGGVN